MIDRSHDLPVAKQCQILSLARSTAYYRPQEASEADLAMMRRMDAIHLEHPFAGSRMLRDMLNRERFAVGRKHVATLMKKMGIEALYKKGSVRNFVCWKSLVILGSDHRCAVKRSANKIANCVFAARHVMGGIFQSFAMLRKASQISFIAASSFGKWPRFLITLRICILRLSMALVV